MHKIHWCQQEEKVQGAGGRGQGAGVISPSSPSLTTQHSLLSTYSQHSLSALSTQHSLSALTLSTHYSALTSTFRA
ncbi:hypothetical protein [Nostoc sp.]|uniref:hypothetical protein n=1 Tax=Nostoc sp. TaxID=1180 RepID=UPI002FF5E680